MICQDNLPIRLTVSASLNRASLQRRAVVTEMTSPVVTGMTSHVVTEMSSPVVTGMTSVVVWSRAQTEVTRRRDDTNNDEITAQFRGTLRGTLIAYKNVNKCSFRMNTGTTQ